MGQQSGQIEQGGKRRGATADVRHRFGLQRVERKDTGGDQSRRCCSGMLPGQVVQQQGVSEVDQEVDGVKAGPTRAGQPVQQVGELEQRPDAAPQVVDPGGKRVNRGVLDDDRVVVELERTAKGVEVGQDGETQNTAKSGFP